MINYLIKLCPGRWKTRKYCQFRLLFDVAARKASSQAGILHQIELGYKIFESSWTTTTSKTSLDGDTVRTGNRDTI